MSRSGTISLLIPSLYKNQLLFKKAKKCKVYIICSWNNSQGKIMDNTCYTFLKENLQIGQVGL